MKKIKKMSTILAIWFLGSVIISVVACILIQYFFLSKQTGIVEFLKHDTIHIMILGSIMFTMFFVVIKVMIVAPLHKVYYRLYALAYRENRGSYCIENEDFEEIIKGLNHLIHIQEKDLECSSMQETHKIIDKGSLIDR